ncbi:MAG: amino acid-binding protein [Planctomycetaceae bacterium]|nr:amino acid-binding protein [Planctomycetaceae bacterium]
MPDHSTCLLRWSGLHGVRSDAVDLPGIPTGWLGLISVSRTPEEASVIGPWTGEGLGPYRAWSVPGPLAPDLVGVLAGFLEPLQAAGISVLAVSTHDTDWLLVEEGRAEAAEAAWVARGIDIRDGTAAS